jgi:hypothetical protein
VRHDGPAPRARDHPARATETRADSLLALPPGVLRPEDRSWLDAHAALQRRRERRAYYLGGATLAVLLVLYVTESNNNI